MKLTTREKININAPLLLLFPVDIDGVKLIIIITITRNRVSMAQEIDMHTPPVNLNELILISEAEAEMWTA